MTDDDTVHRVARSKSYCRIAGRRRILMRSASTASKSGAIRPIRRSFKRRVAGLERSFARANSSSNRSSACPRSPLWGQRSVAGITCVLHTSLLDHKPSKLLIVTQIKIESRLGEECRVRNPWDGACMVQEVLRSGLLKDSKNPLFWIQDRVANKLRAIYADKGCSAGTTLDRIVSHRDASGFEFCTGRAEEAPRIGCT